MHIKYTLCPKISGTFFSDTSN